MIVIKHIYETQNYNKNWINLSKNDLFFRISVFFLTSSLKKYVFYNLLINNVLYLCVT